MKEPKEIVVTGINGFVGEHLAQRLKQDGYTVRGVGRESSPHANVSEYVDEYTQADLLDDEMVKNIPLKQASAIVHLAGLASVAESFDKPDLYKTGNAKMTGNLLSSAKSQDFNGRIVVVSTGALYDSTQAMPLAETAETHESSPYAIGKLRAEDVAKSYKDTGGDIVIARPFNHIGPGQGQGFLLPDLYKQLLAAKERDDTSILVGNLSTKRDYTDVRDIVSAYVQLATAENLEHDTYNISSGISYTGLDILSSLQDRLGLSNITPVIDPSKVRPTDAKEITGDSGRIRSELGWTPQSSMQQAVSDFVEREKIA